MDEKLYIGIDPGVKTGWAVYDPLRVKDRIIEICTKDFMQVLSIVHGIKKGFHWISRDYRPTFYIENPGLNKPTFPRNVSRKAMEKISRNVGANSREAELLIGGIRDYGFTVIECRPKKNKLSRGKMKAKEFQRLTGYEGRTSQHGRDAALLVWGQP